MRKRRLALFILNFLAAGLATASAWLAWWKGDFPATTDFNTLLSSVNVKTDFLIFSVAMVIFVAAGLFLLAAIFANKFFGILGILIGGAIIVLWGINSKIDFFGSGGFILEIGVGAMFAAIFLALIAVFIPKRRTREAAAWRH